jgi:hypothetical protein
MRLRGDRGALTTQGPGAFAHTGQGQKSGPQVTQQYRSVAPGSPVNSYDVLLILGRRCGVPGAVAPVSFLPNI